MIIYENDKLIYHNDKVKDILGAPPDTEGELTVGYIEEQFKKMTIQQS